jgi:topoisomerase IA-like protein
MKTVSILLVSLLLSSCAMNRGSRPDGSQYMSMSFMENTTDEERIITADSFHERKVGKDQTTGGKIIARSILYGVIAGQIANVVEEIGLAKEATKVAGTQATTQAAQISSNEAIRLQELANEAALAELEAAAAVAP